jgi:hypothetical protein
LVPPGERIREFPRPAVALPSTPKLCPEGYQLILDFEVGGGQKYFTRYLQRPTVPGGQSGVTVGVGYDCGYNTAAVILEDWKDFKHAETLARAAGLKQATAKRACEDIRWMIFDWKLSEQVFSRTTITRFYLDTRRAFPGFDELDPRCQAALVSLVFNRGPAKAGSRRKEMRDIADATPVADYRRIARAIRQMKRIWVGTDIEEGMSRRREAEARLVEASI